MEKRRGKAVLKLLLPLCVWLGAWQLSAVAVSQSLLLPGPWEALVCLGRLALRGSFWRACLTTLGRVFLGGVLGSLAGTAVAVLSARFPAAGWIFDPVMRVVRATPVASFIILIWLWCTSAWVPVVISALMAAPVAWAAVAQGLRSTPEPLLEMARAYRYSRWKTARLIYLPSARSAAVAGYRTALGLAWKAGVAAEALCRPRWAMGTEIWNAKTYLETPDLFAWTAAVVLLSCLVEKGLWSLWRLWERRRSNGGA